MTTYNALDEVYGGDFGDNQLPIDCNDLAKICTIGTDYIFDAMNPQCYATGALPNVGDPIPVGGLVNLARDAAPALGRTLSGTVTATPTDVSHLPTFDGYGVVFLPTTKLPLQIHKGGVADKLVGSPADEGFIDFLHIVCFRLTAAPASAATFALDGSSTANGQNAGFKINTNLTFLNFVAGASLGSIALNTLTHLAALYRFNTGAGTSTIQNYVNGVASGAAIAGRNTADYLVANANSKSYLGGGAGYTVPTGKLYRRVREFVNYAADDVSALVAADYAYCAARFTS